MELSFTLKELEELWTESLENYQVYKNALEAFQKEIEELSIYWKSEETGTYEEMKKIFQEKYPKLVETEKMIRDIVNILETKKQSLEESSNKVIQSFE